MAKKKTSQKDFLAGELQSLIPELDEEGLAFLVEQGRIHLYNMQVTELNKAAQEANDASRRMQVITGRAGNNSSGKTAKAGDAFRIEGTKSGSSYYLFYNNSNIMFSRSEMIELVQISKGPGTVQETCERIYNWFVRERKDIFALVPFSDIYDEKLKIIVRLIKKNFSLKP